VSSKWVKGTDNSYEKALENAKENFYLEKEGALQTAIRLGRILFNKTHEDYLDFLVLNTILGDYFGSRLMSNIREDKGYTYGIGSMVAELHETGYFLIATEVGKDVKDAALEEIKKELELLQLELVAEDELVLVKNYMLGQLLKSADGPYSMTDLFLSVEPHGLDQNFYNKAIDALHQITPERIRELAKRYLNWEDLTIVAAG
jgi:predicted Zn-dependent peptidase